MSFGGLKMVGDEQTLVPKRGFYFPSMLLAAALLLTGVATAQTLYKYRGENGEWIFADRPPEDGQQVETRSVQGRIDRAGLTVDHAFNGAGLTFTARNRFYAPMEVAIEFENIIGVEYPHPDQELRWVIPARSELDLLDLNSLGEPAAPAVRYRYAYLPGDPDAQPTGEASYRVPFSVGASYLVTQTYPDSVTHITRDSMYAIDVAMPIGTDIVAARGGIVFYVASTNFKGGPDAREYADLANVVRILHDDGTFAVYAHLNWNTIRVRPGDRVQAGQYIADSGNSGFTSGPHLHFAVQRNMGMRVDSLPIAFRGANSANIVPSTGGRLTAQP